MPAQQQFRAGNRARLNVRWACAFAIVCLSICLTIEISGHLPPQIESGLWWQVGGIALCAWGLNKTKRGD